MTTGQATLAAAALDPGDQVDEVLELLGGRQEDVEQAIADLGDHRRRRNSLGVLDIRDRCVFRFRHRWQAGALGERVGVECGSGGCQLIESSGNRKPAGESPSSNTMRPRRSCQSALAQPASSSRRCSGST